jgi:hypothetical protein
MDNLDTLVILGTQDTGLRKQNKTKTQHSRENKKMRNTDQPNKGSTSSCSRFKITTNNINVKQNKRYKYETV